MKKDKLKSVVLKFSIVFFIVIALLTYFSKTINNMLLPKVKVVSVQTGVIDDTAGSNDMKTHYLLPVSSVDGAGNTGIEPKTVMQQLKRFRWIYVTVTSCIAR